MRSTRRHVYLEEKIIEYFVKDMYGTLYGNNEIENIFSWKSKNGNVGILSRSIEYRICNLVLSDVHTSVLVQLHLNHSS